MGLYSDLEKKYYDALDSLDAKGIPVYSVVDLFEQNNIPSFPLFLILLAVIILVAGFFAVQLIVPASAQLTVQLVNEDGVGLGNQVLLATGENYSAEQTTNASGEVTFLVSRPSIIKISLKNESAFESSPLEVTVDQSVVAKTFYVREKIASFSGTANLIHASTKQAILTPLTVSLSCSEDETFHATLSFTNGSAQLGSIPSSCGQLITSPVTGRITNSPFDASEENIVFEFVPSEEGQGTLLVLVMDQRGKPLSEKTVTITPTDSTTTTGLQVSAQNGVATFETIPASVYTIYASDPSGSFSPAISPKTVSVEANRTADANITLIESSSTAIVVHVTDEENRPVEKAQVELRKNNQVQGYAQTTDETGSVSLNASSNNTYDIRVDHPNYFIATKKEVKAGGSDPISITLSPTGPDNQTLLRVFVWDETNQPISGATVLVTDAAGHAISSEQITGDLGDTTFTQLAPGSYKVVASRPGFGTDIQNVTLKAREVTEVTNTITIGSGSIALHVVNSDGQPTGSGLVDVFNAENNQPLIQNIPIQLDGNARIPVRADQKVYLTARVNGKASTTAGPFSVAKDQTVNQTIFVLDEVNEPTIELKAITDTGQNVDLSTKQLSAGKTYQLQYALRLPGTQSYTQVNAHIRSDTKEGPLDNPIMENDVSFFSTNVKAPFAIVSSGISYSPPQGQGIDFARNKNETAKWINVSWEKPNSGTILVAIPYTVKDYATTGQSLELLHRIEVKTGSKLKRFPEDDVLGTNANMLEKQGLYAKTLVDAFKVGVSAACNQNVCTSWTATDLTQKVAIVLSETIESEIESKYGFSGNFTTQDGFIPGMTSLRVSQEADSGVELSKVLLQLSNGRSIPVLGTPISNTPMGFMGERETFALSFDVKTVKEGTASLLLQLVQDQTIVWEKTIRFSTKAGRPLNVDILPKALVANADNHVLVTVKDTTQAVIASALVSATINNETGPQVFSNDLGKAEFTLSNLAAGSTVLIRVQKQGFGLFEQSFTAGNDVLLMEPNPLSESFTVDGKSTKVQNIVLRNATNQQLTITQIKWPTLQNYATIKVTSANIPVTLDPEGSVNLSLEFKTTSKGQNIARPLSLSQNASISVVDAKNRKRYTQSYPVSLTIGLNGFTDSAECLSVSPGTWKIITSGEQTVVAGEMTNNCTADGEPIHLLEARARVDWQNSNPIGTFGMQSQGSDTRGNITLSNTFQTVAGTIPKGGKIPIQFSFTANSIPTATSHAVIEVAGINRTEEELQTLLQKISVDVTVNNVYACIKVASLGKVEVVTNPLQLGMDLYQNNPAATTGKTTTTIPSYLQSGTLANFPDPTYRGGFIDPRQDNYQSPTNPAFNNTVAKSATKAPNTTNQIQVTNTCTSPVDITLMVPEQIGVDHATFQVKPKESAFVTVNSGYKPGIFDVTFLGKASGSSAENAARIASVSVSVKTINPKSLGANCISLSTNQFAFSNLPFGVGGFPAEVMNRCYTQGVRIADGGGGIQLFDNGLANYPANRDASPYYANYLQMGQGQTRYEETGYPANATYANQPSSPYYQNGYPNNPQYPNAATYPDFAQYNPYQQTTLAGGTISGPTQGLATGVIILGRYTKGNSEIVRFAVQKNSGYQRSPPIPVNGQTFATNGPTGAFYNNQLSIMPVPQSGGAAITNPATLSVNFTDAWGNAQSKNFPVQITDLMTSPEFVKHLDERGNPLLKNYQECIPSAGIARNMNDEWFTAHCLDKSQAPCLEAAEEIPLKDVLRIDRDHCGATDYFETIEPATIDQSGVALTIQVDETSKAIRITANRAKAGKAKEPITINQPLKAKLIRPVLGREQEIDLKGNFNVYPVGATSGGSQDLAIKEICENKRMGNVFTPSIQYDWQWENWGTKLTSQLLKNRSDNSKTHYADGTQFAIELAKRLGTKEDGFMQKIEAARAMKTKTLTDSTFTSSEEKEAVMNSDNLYRFLKDQIEVIRADGSTINAFFLDSDEMPIKRPLTEMEKNELESITKELLDRTKSEINDPNQIATLAKSLKDSMDSIKGKDKFQTAWDDAVLVWKNSETTLDSIKGVKVIPGKNNNRIQTATDFYTFIDQLYNACFETKESKTTVKTTCNEGMGVNDVTITLPLLQRYANFELIIAARNKKGEKPIEERNVILEQAADDETGITLSDYYSNLEFQSYLMRDQLSADFWRDFKNAYEDHEEESALFDLIDNRENEGQPMDSAELEHRIGGPMADNGLPTAVTFESAGRYDVNLVYTWKTDSQQDELIITAKRDDQKSEKNLSDLYQLALDGPLGISGTGSNFEKAGDGTRDGYGTTLNGGEINQEIVFGMTGSNEGDTLTDKDLRKLTGEAFTTIDWTTQLDWDEFETDEMQKGRVWLVKKGKEGDNEYEMKFIPSVKVELSARIRSDGSRKGGWNYSLIGSGKYLEEDGINWKQTGERTVRTKLLTDRYGYCGQEITGSYTREIQSLETDLTGVAFVPMGESTWQLYTTCAKPELALSIQRTVGKTKTDLTPTQQEKSGSQPVLLNDETTIYPLTELFDLAQEKNGYCFLQNEKDGTTQVVWQ